VSAPESGRRNLPHTADIIIEAWAPSREACLAQAVLALVESFADVSGAGATQQVPLRIAPADDEELLVALLEEVVYIVEVLQVIPVDVHVEGASDGGLAGRFDVVPLSAASSVGAAPKAITRSGLKFEAGDPLWTCRAVVDV
jgi:SHS2 domain-containing protein